MDFDDEPTTIELSLWAAPGPRHLEQSEPYDGAPPPYIEIVLNDPGVLQRKNPLAPAEVGSATAANISITQAIASPLVLFPTIQNASAADSTVVRSFKVWVLG